MEKLPQTVLKRLQETPLGAESHPDPNLLTAFAEHSLSGRERVFIVDHLAQCRDCRDILALAAAAAEPSESLTPQVVRPTPAPWFAWPALRWAALAAGVAIVASLGIVHYRHPRQDAQIASNLLPSQSPMSSPTAAAPSAATPSQPEPSTDANPSAAATRTGLRHTPRSEPSARSENESALAAAPNALPSKTANQLAFDAGSATRLAQNQPPPPLSGQSMDVDVVKAKNPILGQSGPSNIPTATPQGAQPASPANLRWAINGGALQRSGDGGRTWQGVNPRPDFPADFYSIAVNASEVWVGGSAATLYHSTDAGAHWAAVTPSSNGATLTGNVIGIQFSDLLHGKITTSTSEAWITSDAGQTWLKQQ